MSLGAHEYLTRPEKPTKALIVDGFSAKEMERGDWCELNNGKKFYVLDPNPDALDEDAIIHALSNLCRFGGHTSNFYSVAEHCTNVARRVWKLYGSRSLALKAAWHDGSEGILVDIPRPIKPSLTNYKTIEKKIQDMIYVKFCGSVPTEEEEALIKAADTEMLWIEGYQLMPSRTAIWENDGDSSKYLPIAIGHERLGCFPPGTAKANMRKTVNVLQLTWTSYVDF